MLGLRELLGSLCGPENSTWRSIAPLHEHAACSMDVRAA